MGRHTRARFPRLAARLYAHKKRLRSERIEFVRKKGYATRLCFFFSRGAFWSHHLLPDLSTRVSISLVGTRLFSRRGDKKKRNEDARSYKTGRRFGISNSLSEKKKEE